MNEEEKEAIEKVCNFAKFTIDEYGKKEDNKYLKIVRNLISKQQKEIEELKDDLKEERALNVEALKTLKECVHKDKIKEKIEEVEKKKEKIEILDFKAFYSIKEIKNIEINILKELLGGEND